jgi:hypothetical protein
MTRKDFSKRYFHICKRNVSNSILNFQEWLVLLRKLGVGIFKISQKTSRYQTHSIIMIGIIKTHQRITAWLLKISNNSKYTKHNDSFKKFLPNIMICIHRRRKKVSGKFKSILYLPLMFFVVYLFRIYI